MRPISLGRKNRLFADSVRAGKVAAVIMSLAQSAKLQGKNLFAYLKDVLTRLPSARPRISTPCCRISGDRPEPARAWAPRSIGTCITSRNFAIGVGYRTVTSLRWA